MCPQEVDTHIGFLSIFTTAETEKEAWHRGNYTCGKISLTGSIVSESSPYLFPLIIEYSLIGACVLFIMWKNIGRCPRYVDRQQSEGDGTGPSRHRQTPSKVSCGRKRCLVCKTLEAAAACHCFRTHGMAKWSAEIPTCDRAGWRTRFPSPPGHATLLTTGRSVSEGTKYGCGIE